MIERPALFSCAFLFVACGDGAARSHHVAAANGRLEEGRTSSSADPPARPPRLSVEGALGVREFSDAPPAQLPDRIRIRGFLVRGRSPDIDLADLPLMTAGWVHLADVPPTLPGLLLFRCYVFELVRRDPDVEEEKATRGFHYAAHSAAEPPPGPSSPTYPDGSWSIRDLHRRTDLNVGDTVRVTAKIVMHVYKCPPCPPRRHCQRCPAPVAEFQGDASGDSISIPYRQSDFSPAITFGNRYAFEFKIDPSAFGGLRFLPPAPRPPTESDW